MEAPEGYQLVAVETGVSDANNTEIFWGVDEGATVYLNATPNTSNAVTDEEIPAYNSLISQYKATAFVLEQKPCFSLSLANWHYKIIANLSISTYSDWAYNAFIYQTTKESERHERTV